MLKWHHHIKQRRSHQNGYKDRSQVQIHSCIAHFYDIKIQFQIFPILLHMFHSYEYFPWWHDDDDFTIHLMKNRSNDSDWSESSPISNKLQTMKLLSHICNSCLMTQWYIDSHVLVPCSADSLALLSVISVCWTVIQHSPDQGGPHSYQTWQLGSKIHCIALLNVFSCHAIQ